MDADSVSIIRDYVNELLLYASTPLLLLHRADLVCDAVHRYMVKERGRLFQREYESASMQYQNISRS